MRSSAWSVFFGLIIRYLIHCAALYALKNAEICEIDEDVWFKAIKEIEDVRFVIIYIFLYLIGIVSDNRFARPLFDKI